MKDKNRCLSASPGLGWRCELRKGHIEKSHDEGFPFPEHRAGFAHWSPEEGTIWTGPQNRIFPARGFDYSTPPTLDPTIGMPLTSWQKWAMVGALAGRSTTDADRLAAWWRRTAEAEIEQTVAKAVEYGSTDLIDIGRSLARVAGREVDDEEAAEMGVFFYLEGKLSRWRSTLERGDRPSLDTLLDIGVYARMAQRIRYAGSWPGTEEEETDAVMHSMCDTSCGPNCSTPAAYPNRSAE